SANTRSGSYSAIASTLGSNPDRSVVGASSGWFDCSSTATTWSPAPTANSVSVAVGDSDTIRSGSDSTVTLPLIASTVTGNAAASAGPGLVAVLVAVLVADPSSEPHAASRTRGVMAATRAALSSSTMTPPLR